MENIRDIVGFAKVFLMNTVSKPPFYVWSLIMPLTLFSPFNLHVHFLPWPIHVGMQTSTTFHGISIFENPSIICKRGGCLSFGIQLAYAVRPP